MATLDDLRRRRPGDRDRIDAIKKQTAAIVSLVAQIDELKEDNQKLEKVALLLEEELEDALAYLCEAQEMAEWFAAERDFIAAKLRRVQCAR